VFVLKALKCQSKVCDNFNSLPVEGEIFEK